MTRRTIAIERSAYERLKAARHPGESFTHIINRLLAEQEPRISDFVGLFDRKTADSIAKSVAAVREEEVRHERKILEKRRWPNGDQG